MESPAASLVDGLKIEDAPQQLTRSAEPPSSDRTLGPMLSSLHFKISPPAGGLSKAFLPAGKDRNREARRSILSRWLADQEDVPLKVSFLGLGRMGCSGPGYQP